MPETKYHWYTVPAGTREVECRGCKEPIYWITTPKGAKLPVDCSVDGAWAPTDARSTTQSDGHGVSHFQTCSKAAQFSGKGRTRNA